MQLIKYLIIAILNGYKEGSKWVIEVLVSLCCAVKGLTAAGLKKMETC